MIEGLDYVIGNYEDLENKNEPPEGTNQGYGPSWVVEHFKAKAQAFGPVCGKRRQNSSFWES